MSRYRINLVAFMQDSCVMIGATALPFFVFNQLGGGPGMSGVIGAFQMGAYAMACLLTAGFVSRSKNGLHWAIPGVVIFTITYSLVPFSRNPMLCAILAIVAVSSLSLVWPALHSWIGSEPDPQLRNRYMSTFNISWSFGFAVSPLAAGPLYDLDYRLPFVLLFTISIVVLTLILTLPHERTLFGTASQAMLEARSTYDKASETYLYTAWCANLLTTLLAGVTRAIFPKRMEELVASGELRWLFEDQPIQLLTHGPATKYSWLAFSMAGATAIVFLFLGRTNRWQHRFWLLAVTQLLAGAGFWTLSFTKSLLIMIACFIVVGISGGIAFFSSVTYSVANPELKHRRAAINESAVGAGAFIGCIGFGYAAEHWGLGVPFAYTPWIMFAGVVIQYLLLDYSKKRTSNIPKIQ